MSQLAGTGAPTPRRSARISQAGSVTGQSAVTAVSVGGTKQRKKGPLTKVKPRKSNAYGASGRVGAAEELSVTATGFAQAFQSQRGDAVARDDQDEDEDDIDELGAVTPRRSSQTNGHSAFFPSDSGVLSSFQDLDDASSQNSEEPTPSDDWLATSVGDTSKSFGLLHEAGMLPRSTRQSSSRVSEVEQTTPRWKQNVDRRAHLKLNEEQEPEEDRVRRQRPTAVTSAQNGAAKPTLNGQTMEQHTQRVAEAPPQGSAQQQSAATRRYILNPQAVNEWLGGIRNAEAHERSWPSKKMLMRGFWIILTTMGIFLALSAYRSSTISTNHQRYGIMNALNDRLSETRHGLAEWIKPGDGNKRGQLTWADLDRAAGLDGGDAVMGPLQKLYTHFDLRMDEMHDSMSMLKNQLPDLVVVRRNPDGTKQITDDFWSALKSKLSSPTGSAEWEEFLENNKQKLNGILGVPHVVNDVDARPVAVTRQEILKMMNDRSNPISARIDQEVAKAMQAQASQIKAIAQTEARQAKVDAMRLQSMAETNLLANYESNMLKANYFSSGLGAIIDAPSTSTTFLDTSGLLSRFAQRFLSSPQRNPPSTALSKWEEPGECWCAAPNPTQNTQLSINIARPIFPNQVTIEHVPKTMVPAQMITSAPRHIEFWVESDGPVSHRYHNRKNACKDGPPGYVCLGAFKYNIHASNHVQTFDLDTEVTAPVRKTMVRVLSNWGAEYTCLYRVRLHGRDADPDFEYKVSLNDPAE